MIRRSGFDQNLNCHMAIKAVLDLHRQGYKFVLDADVKGLFDNIPLPVIMDSIASEIFRWQYSESN